MKISVVIPVKNGVKFLEETLDSICQQKGNFNLQILIEDGNSTDGTIEMIKAYQSRYNSKRVEIVLESREDGNMYAAVINGLNKANGNVVTWISSNDFYVPQALSTVAEIFSKNQSVHWLTGIPLSFNEQGQNHYYKSPIFYSNKLIKQGFYNGKMLHFVQQESCFMSNHALSKIDVLSLLEYSYAADQKLWMLLAEHFQLFQVNSFLAGSRQHKQRVSQSTNYTEEFKKMRSRRTPLAYALAGIQYVATYFFPEKLKQLLSPRLFTFKKGSWAKN
jgi:glycosyltransferase involved in cell wall biosynthesis